MRRRAQPLPARQDGSRSVAARAARTIDGSRRSPARPEREDPGMMRRQHILCASAGCILLVAGGAAAEIVGTRAEVSPYVGGIVVDDKHGFESNAAPLLGARFGFAVTPRVALEAQGGWARFDARDAGGVLQSRDIGFASGGVSVDITNGARVRPFLAVGGGYAEDLTTDARGSIGHPFGEFGGGLKIVGGTGFGIRLEARQVVMAKAVPDGREMLQNTTFGARAVLPFARVHGDGDADGIRDNRDLCSATPAGASVDAKGCPTDGDSDGVFDGIDVCMNTPAGATVDGKGCPSDSDADGVVDGLDVCLSTPAGAQVDTRGCPTDADADGVVDGLDRCPDTAAGKRVDEKGCEVSKLEYEMLDTGRLRLQGVNFVSGKAELQPSSFRVLDEAGDLLSRWPQLQIEIGGHTDSRGAAAKNRTLSERRAQAVADYLLARFPQISSAQLRVRGYGEEQPIAGNETDDGRSRNRRVEFVVMNREELRQVH
jgi:outer membrane protein OmpA-like peptidoglycan-associated protein